MPPAPGTPAAKRKWTCRCECGTERLVNAYNLANGSSKSCGCYLRETATARARAAGRSWVGERYGRLVILGKSEQKVGRSFWLKAKCDCGQTKLVRPDLVARGGVKSCGCLRKEKSRDRLRKLNKKKAQDITRKFLRGMFLQARLLEESRQKLRHLLGF